MNSDFVITVNGAPLPSVVQLKADASSQAKFTITAKDGATSKGVPWSLDTEGALIPLDVVRGLLDDNGQATFNLGPAAMLGSVLKGNAGIVVTVGKRNQKVKVALF
jgi:hypothetical protein